MNDNIRVVAQPLLAACALSVAACSAAPDQIAGSASSGQLIKVTAEVVTLEQAGASRVQWEQAFVRRGNPSGPSRMTPQGQATARTLAPLPAPPSASRGLSAQALERQVPQRRGRVVLRKRVDASLYSLVELRLPGAAAGSAASYLLVRDGRPAASLEGTVVRRGLSRSLSGARISLFDANGRMSRYVTLRFSDGLACAETEGRSIASRVARLALRVVLPPALHAQDESIGGVKICSAEAMAVFTDIAKGMLDGVTTSDAVSMANDLYALIDCLLAGPVREPIYIVCETIYVEQGWWAHDETGQLYWEDASYSYVEEDC